MTGYFLFGTACGAAAVAALFVAYLAYSACKIGADLDNEWWG